MLNFWHVANKIHCSKIGQIISFFVKARLSNTLQHFYHNITEVTCIFSEIFLPVLPLNCLINIMDLTTNFGLKNVSY